MSEQQPMSPRQRMQALLAIPERQRTDAQWDELIELEIMFAPGNREGGPQPGRRNPNQGQGGHPNQGQGGHSKQGQGGGGGGNAQHGKKSGKKFHKRPPKPNNPNNPQGS